MQALIGALQQRYPGRTVVTQAEFDGWDDDYAAAMAAVYVRFPDQLDVISLYAEALMTRTPWQLWDVHRGVPADGADTVAAIEALERGRAFKAVRKAVLIEFQPKVPLQPHRTHAY